MDKVELGFFSFTEVTDPGQHRAYNEWHQLDHMPEQFRLPGIAAGHRWVSTPECRAARRVSGELLDPTHYVTMYLVTEPVDETLRAFMELAEELRRQDRWFEPRVSHLSGPFRVMAAHASPRIRVSAEALPLRPHRGVWVTVDEDTGSRASGEGPPAELSLPGVAGVWSFGSGDRSISVWFLDEPIGGAGPALGDALGDPALFSGPLEAITPWEWGWFDA